MNKIARSKSLQNNNDGLSIVLCGQAGQGIQTVEYLLTRIFKLTGFNVFATKEYMSRVRGGTNSTEIRLSPHSIGSPLNRIDILVGLDTGAVEHVKKRLSPQTLILAQKDDASKKSELKQYNIIDVDFTKIATEIGNKIFSNVVAVGMISALLGIDLKSISAFTKQYFAGKSEDIIQNNIAALEAGYKQADDLSKNLKTGYKIEKDSNIAKQILLSGADAVGLGAIAGGCNFVSSYPMSPSTAVLIFLAKHAKDFGIIVEQAEDEIAAINMAIGAWYAGGRAMVTTSGGGFALMTEGVSLAGMLESPIVIHLAQRPGPATGLPTRTEQGDLELALYAGHGEFPRIILAPGSLNDAFYLTQKAFNLADKYQVPVLILTDQNTMDSYYNIPPFETSAIKVEKHIVETDEDYQRYALNKSGISPRGIPGFGKGLVAVDSDEHDQDGHITEDLDLRIKMVDKRLRKLNLSAKETIAPELTGPKDYKTLVVCWGSTYHIAAEALKLCKKDNVSLLHFKQVYPLPPQTKDYFKKAKKIIIVENNATAQFAKLIKLHADIDIKHRILKYNGLNFFVEELAEKLNEVLN